jgi:large subunit ribosomal protein L23
MSGSQVNYKLYDVIHSPLITEKATKLTEVNQVAFVVNTAANKQEIKDAVELAYNVKVTAVNTINQKGKQKRFRGKLGVRSDVKKALVTLDKGQTIDIASGI